MRENRKYQGNGFKSKLVVTKETLHDKLLV